MPILLDPPHRYLATVRNQRRCFLWKITLKDSAGTKKRFTSADVTITFKEPNESAFTVFDPAGGYEADAIRKEGKRWGFRYRAIRVQGGTARCVLREWIVVQSD